MRAYKELFGKFLLSFLLRYFLDYLCSQALRYLIFTANAINMTFNSYSKGLSITCSRPSLVFMCSGKIKPNHKYSLVLNNNKNLSVCHWPQKTPNVKKQKVQILNLVVQKKNLKNRKKRKKNILAKIQIFPSAIKWTNNIICLPKNKHMKPPNG